MLTVKLRVFKCTSSQQKGEWSTTWTWWKFIVERGGQRLILLSNVLNDYLYQAHFNQIDHQISQKWCQNVPNICEKWSTNPGPRSRAINQSPKYSLLKMFARHWTQRRCVASQLDVLCVTFVINPCSVCSIEVWIEWMKTEKCWQSYFFSDTVSSRSTIVMFTAIPRREPRCTLPRIPDLAATGGHWGRRKMKGRVPYCFSAAKKKIMTSAQCRIHWMSNCCNVAVTVWTTLPVFKVAASIHFLDVGTAHATTLWILLLITFALCTGCVPCIVHIVFSRGESFWERCKVYIWSRSCFCTKYARSWVNSLRFPLPEKILWRWKSSSCKLSLLSFAQDYKIQPNLLCSRCILRKDGGLKRRKRTSLTLLLMYTTASALFLIAGQSASEMVEVVPAWTNRNTLILRSQSKIRKLRMLGLDLWRPNIDEKSN